MVLKEAFPLENMSGGETKVVKRPKMEVFSRRTLPTSLNLAFPFHNGNPR
jgi:hypothetical protein